MYLVVAAKCFITFLSPVVSKKDSSGSIKSPTVTLGSATCRGLALLKAPDLFFDLKSN